MKIFLSGYNKSRLTGTVIMAQNSEKSYKSCKQVTVCH